MAGIAVAPLIHRVITIPEVSVPNDFSAVTGEEPSVSGDAGGQGAIEDVDPHRDAGDEVFRLAYTHQIARLVLGEQ